MTTRSSNGRADRTPSEMTPARVAKRATPSVPAVSLCVSDPLDSDCSTPVGQPESPRTLTADLTRRDFCKAGAAFGAGCFLKPKPIDALLLAVLIDPTGSAQDNVAVGRPQLKRALQRARLPEGSEVATIRVDAFPKVTWSGGTNVRTMVAAIDAAWSRHERCWAG